YGTSGASHTVCRAVLGSGPIDISKRSTYMKLHFPTRFGITLTALGGLTLALCTVAFRAQADVWDKKTVLTVSQPIQVQDTYLEPGTYVFKLLDSSSDRHIVQIFNR